jgi:hypothetical protein
MGSAQLDSRPADRSQESLPPDWQEDYRRLSELVLDLSARYGDQILIRLFDPRSPHGMFTALTHGLRCYPSFIIAGRHKVSGLDPIRLEQALRDAGVSPAAGPQTGG